MRLEFFIAPTKIFQGLRAIHIAIGERKIARWGRVLERVIYYYIGESNLYVHGESLSAPELCCCARSGEFRWKREKISPTRLQTYGGCSGWELMKIV